MFDNMPAIAAVTLLTKLQNDIRQAESEAMSNLITNVDIGDVRVNELNAYVIPNSNMVMRGGKYTANIVLAAIDTTQRPAVFVNGSKLNNDRGILEFTAGAAGSHDYSGYIEVMRGGGTVAQHPFKSSYTVMADGNNIGNDDECALCRHRQPYKHLRARSAYDRHSGHNDKRHLTRNGDAWIAKATQVGAEAVISVSAQMDGRTQKVGSMTFRVRKLPDPSPYIP